MNKVWKGSTTTDIQPYLESSLRREEMTNLYWGAIKALCELGIQHHQNNSEQIEAISKYLMLATPNSVSPNQHSWRLFSNRYS